LAAAAVEAPRPPAEQRAAARAVLGMLVRAGQVRRAHGWLLKRRYAVVLAEEGERGDEVAAVAAGDGGGPAPPAPPAPPSSPSPYPWLDERGAVNVPLWRALSSRCLAAALRHPGLPESLLLQQLGDVLSPAAARRLARLLVAGGALEVRRAPAAAASAAVPSLLLPAGSAAARWRRGRPGVAAGSAAAASAAAGGGGERFYFPALGASLTAADRLLPPHLAVVRTV
jgi:hypothetical protein